MMNPELLLTHEAKTNIVIIRAQKIYLNNDSLSPFLLYMTCKFKLVFSPSCFYVIFGGFATQGRGKTCFLLTSERINLLAWRFFPLQQKAEEFMHRTLQQTCSLKLFFTTSCTHYSLVFYSVHKITYFFFKSLSLLKHLV